MSPLLSVRLPLICHNPLSLLDVISLLVYRNYLLAFLYSFTIHWYITFLKYSVNLFEQYLLRRTLFILWICIFIVLVQGYSAHISVTCCCSLFWWLSLFIEQCTVYPLSVGAGLVVHVCWCSRTGFQDICRFPHGRKAGTSCETSPLLKWHKAKGNYH